MTTLNTTTTPSTKERKPRIVMVIPRGEAVRNFLYSDTLPLLKQSAELILLSVVADEKFRARFGPLVDEIIELKEYKESKLIKYLDKLVHDAHFRWLWSEVAQNRWQMFDIRQKTLKAKTARLIWKGVLRVLANWPTLRALTWLEQKLRYALRPTREFDTLFARTKPDLVFNGSHIHGPASELPLVVANRMGIRTAGFVFSWDNLTSRSRIVTPYDDYLVWHQGMHDQLLQLYPEIPRYHVYITGTPQFDFHQKPQFWLTREALCAKIGLDPARPFILYTTGIPKHFPFEHLTVAFIARELDKLDINFKPQLLVRTYAKGTSKEMLALAEENLPGVVFQPLLWDAKWMMPLEEDYTVYTSILRHCCMGINAASTVSLELMMHDKPVINLGLNPPGSVIPRPYWWSRHIIFDHYKPVADSGGVMVAYNEDELRAMLKRGLIQPDADSDARCAYINKVFGSTLDGKSGERVAATLLELATT